MIDLPPPPQGYIWLKEFIAKEDFGKSANYGQHLRTDWNEGAPLKYRLIRVVDIISVELTDASVWPTGSFVHVREVGRVVVRDNTEDVAKLMVEAIGVRSPLS